MQAAILAGNVHVVMMLTTSNDFDPRNRGVFITGYAFDLFQSKNPEKNDALDQMRTYYAAGVKRWEAQHPNEVQQAMADGTRNAYALLSVKEPPPSPPPRHDLVRSLFSSQPT